MEPTATMENRPKEYDFNTRSETAVSGLAARLRELLGDHPAVFVCIGSDAVAGDSLSPLVGSLLKEFYRLPAYVYGELAHTVTAKELPLYSRILRALHPGRKVVAIDASVGSEEEVGLLKVREGGLFPGKGVGKRLAPVGDVSVLGVVSPRGKDAFQRLELTRVRLVYRMATQIAAAVAAAVDPPTLFPRPSRKTLPF